LARLVPEESLNFVEVDLSRQRIAPSEVFL
jgi:hypothetical protein